MGAIAPSTHMGPVHLTVADLARSLDYYGTAIGLQTLARRDGGAELGVPGRTLLVLEEVPGALPADGYTGLFHFALLVPERTDLARWLVHAARERVPLTGASDHYVSEALYLRDPDHHGIEIYADRPREHWEGDVERRMGSWPLDLDDLIGSLGGADEPFDGLPAGTVMGHVHLRVADVDATETFYRDAVGFDVMAHLGAQATFLSAGGYHHHLGGNVWESRGAPPPPPGSAALHHATVLVPNEAEAQRVAERVRAAGYAVEDTDGGAMLTDPAGNRMLVSSASL